MLFIGSLAIQSATAETAPTPEEVKAVTNKVATWQIETFEDQVKYRALSTPVKKKIAKAKQNPKVKLGRTERYTKKWHDLEWHNAALYAGMNEWRKVSGETEYTAWLRSIGERNDWRLWDREYHADDHAVGQFYLDLYEEFRDPEMIAPTVERFNGILENPKTGSILFKKGTDAHDRWGWCDALFMAPPVWARLAKVTGEERYLDFMDQEYHNTYDLLWDEEEDLFFRDSTFFEKREANGEKIFWARGNGWVFGGLALMIPDLPEDWEGRQFYVELYKKMAARLLELQRPDGTWSMGLLGGTEGYPVKETSGTAFFTFGLSWGVNNGFLDRAIYEPTILKGWNALAECVTDEGMLGHVQPVGAAPGDSFPNKSEVYGVGAFLAAGSEVYQLVGGELPAGE